MVLYAGSLIELTRSGAASMLTIVAGLLGCSNLYIGSSRLLRGRGRGRSPFVISAIAFALASWGWGLVFPWAWPHWLGLVLAIYGSIIAGTSRGAE